MSALGTFFGWRGAHHGKRGARAAAETARGVGQLNQRQREQELRERGLIGFNATPREVREVEMRLALERRERERAYRAQRRAEQGAAWRRLGHDIADWWRQQKTAHEPIPAWAFWTLGVLALLLALTVVGLPLTVFIGLYMYLRHPWGPVPVADAPTAAIPAVDAPTVTLTAVREPATVGRHSR